MPLAKEGLREIVLATLVLGAISTALAWWVMWPFAIPFVVVWMWVLSFFRDPRRVRVYQTGEVCSACDGTITEITRLEHDERVGGPAVRIGAFLSLFNVHVNRSPCAGTVTSVVYKPGEFLDARDPRSGDANESNTLVIQPDEPIHGPIVVRQVSGLVARRIICHAGVGDSMAIGYRFGLIKFGSRTEVIIPDVPDTQILVEVGDKVKAGLTIIAKQA